MSRQNFSLNGWIVDVAGGRISQDKRTRHLEPKVMKTLAYLASRPNEVVTKDQLVEAVWDHSYVSDAALTRCIFEIRQAFGDDAKKPTVIETIPKVGYRLVATPHISCKLVNFNSRPLRWVTATAIPLIALLAWSTIATPVDARITESVEGISDNPLANRAYRRGVEHFEDRTNLANLNAIALFRKATEYDPSFGLAYAYLSLSLAQQILHWGGDSLVEVQDAASKAIELEPLNGQAHNAFGLAQLVSQNSDGALESFRRANELDPTHWISLYNAAITHLWRFEYADAEILLLRVLEHEPEHIGAMSRLGRIFLRYGDTDSARYWLDKTLEQAPQSVIAWSELAILELVTRNVSKAIENCERVTEMIPTHDTCLHIAAVGHFLEGNTAEADKIFDFVIEKLPRSDYAELGKAKILLSSGKTNQGIAAVNIVLERTLLKYSENDDPWRESRILAACYALLGDKMSALSWLEKSSESGRHFSLWDATDPVFADLHGDQRFNRFIAMARNSE